VAVLVVLLEHRAAATMMSMTASGPDVQPSPPGGWVGLVTGFAVAMIACGGILSQRLSRGDLKTAFVAHVLLTIAVLAALRSERVTARDECFSPKLVAQFVGGIAGIVVAHCILQSSGLGAVPWLSERPAQFVNDVVAVFAPLAIVRAANRRPPSTLVLVITLALVTAYRATGFWWHLDAARFSYTVQDFVTGEFASSALGIATFRLLVPG
jgi:hypothetical protein